MHPNDQSQHPLPELQARVGKIVLLLMLEACLVLVVGLFLLLFSLSILLDAFRLGQARCELIAVPAPALALMCFGVFVFQIAAEFGRLKPWTYRWVEFLTRTSRWGFVSYGDLYSPEVRKAFHQPELEHPDHPK